MEKLSEYPKLIANVASELAQTDCQIRQLKLAVEQLEAVAECAIATNLDLKNDQQRKAFKFSYLQEEPNYRTNLEAIELLNTDRAGLVVTLERLRNEFSVLKLETRLTIASTLAAIEDKELVDSSL